MSHSTLNELQAYNQSQSSLHLQADHLIAFAQQASVKGSLYQADLISQELKLSYDIVVVGSGAGGSTIACLLAQAGKNVLLVEEGKAYRSAEYSANFSGMTSEIMRNAGATIITGRSPIAYVEGKVVGGSTVLNGGMCWRTPDEVLHHWSQDRGLKHLAPDQMQSAFDTVEHVIDARYQDEGSEGHNNYVFKKGVDQLNWKIQKNKRNQQHCVGSNDCVTGCPTSAKRSAALTWVPRFLQAGGDLITSVQVKKVLVKEGKAVGVSAVILDPVKPRKIRIEAKKVILACGAVQTPLLIQRSKITKNKHVGQHFTIHPNVKVAALFDQKIESMKGVHQAWQCTEFQQDGILLAPGGVPLSVISQMTPLLGPSLTEQMKLAPYVATGGLLVDDSITGYVKARWAGWNQIHYDISDYDQSKFIQGVQYMAQLYFAAGARKVYTPFINFPTIDHPNQIASLNTWLPKVEDTEYFTAHLMGTCRMSSNANEGVVDAQGKCWDVEGLYIADASIMPGTIGVNPQVTIMALALKVAEGLMG